ncbi:hypothetical protein L9F63_021529, partial [Diploptera punctata]
LYDFQWNVLAFSTSLRHFFLSCAVDFKSKIPISFKSSITSSSHRSLVSNNNIGLVTE